MKKHLITTFSIITALIAVFLMGLFLGRNISSSPIRISAGTSDGPAAVTTVPTQETTEEEPVEFPIDINSADISELTALPGIGEVLAQRIVEYRDSHGAFIIIEDLMDVYGISEKRFEAIKDYIVIGG